MAHERLVMAAALTRTVKYSQYAVTVMKSEMIWQAIADPGDIVRSIADAATSQSKNDDHNGDEGISDG